MKKKVKGETKELREACKSCVIPRQSSPSWLEQMCPSPRQKDQGYGLYFSTDTSHLKYEKFPISGNPSAGPPLGPAQPGLFCGRRACPHPSRPGCLHMACSAIQPFHF
ncbi:hypothetical protein E2C01_005988 [Portunus trituberculatus]|uniref:Uncharacterized protein n=1 Tax=Portunus trituberculatus TaxID=210409 RepID=A0A5B7CU34_PORTR|nr:hypothetical protein [Portunus trituberculatus]